MMIIKLCVTFIIILYPNFIYCKSTNSILNHADSLGYQGKFKEMAEFLLPLENIFENETDLNKYHYYGLVSLWYMRQNDYDSAIKYLEKKSQYNHTGIEDTYYLANLFSTEYLDRNKAALYARKSLLLDDEITKLGYIKDHTDEQIGRLHYILGILACRLSNRILAEEHLNWIKDNNKSIDINSVNHLVTSIENITNNENEAAYYAIRGNSLELLKDSFIINETEDATKNYGKIYDVSCESELDTIVYSKDLDMYKYLHTIFFLEDKYDRSDIKKAVALLRKACEIVNLNKFYKIPSLELCELYMRLGRGDYFLKKYDSAITWFLLSYKDSRKIGNGIKYNVQALGEIADIYLEKGVKYKSIIYADEMLEEILKLKAKEGLNMTALTYISRYANILSNTGFNSMAENLYKFLIDVVPKKSQAYSLACNNYATYLFLNNRRDEGCYYYSLIKDAFPTPQTISNLSIAYLISNKLPEAEDVFHDYYEKNLSELEIVLKNFTEPEWTNFWEKLGYEFYISSNYLAYNINTSTSLNTGYKATVLSKSLPLKYKERLNQLLSSSQDPRIHNLYSAYIDKKKRLSTGKIGDPFNQRLIDEVKSLEDSLLKKINFKDKLRSLICDYSIISNSLTHNEIAIEFCQYLDILAPQDSISYKYAAYIISPEYDHPIFVIIGDEIEISNLIFKSQKDELSINQFYSQNKIGDLIWGKLMPYISNKSVVYFSPIGELSLVNHQLLKCSNIVLGDKFNMKRISSTNVLVNKGTNFHNEYTEAILYGDIDYNTIYEEMKTNASQYGFNGLSNNLAFESNENRDGWSSLPNTRLEVDSINSLLCKRGCTSVVYDGKKATEESFKSLDYRSPSIIHIATHGFSYFGNEDNEKRNNLTSLSRYTTENILMSWTGLLFSGANNTWTGKHEINDFEDGILTATEISLLNLNGAKLVVLSACNTGLGINDKFGVTIGLQKAFKMAGVQSILMSLWKVPDESTALLMTKFYEALFSGNNRHEALKIAMKKVRKLYPDPYYWGAFVILD